MNLESQTLVEALELTAARVPERGITLYDRSGRNPEFRGYAALLDNARLSARRLAAAGVARGDRVLLCLPTSWNLLDLFLGVVFCGAYPTLVAPAGALGGAAANAKKIEALLELMTPKCFIFDGTNRTDGTDKRAITPAELAALTPAPESCLHRPAPDDLAFMQLTSGSTGRQRAVMIPHAAALHNARANGVMVGITKVASCQLPVASQDAARTGNWQLTTDNGCSVVSWLPLNHDMGLIGCFVSPMVLGLHLHLLRPETFLARPRVWLQILSTQRDAISSAPNFAYQLCVERITPEDMQGLDLSGWRWALTGAEMVRPETCRAFAAKFAACGFKAEAFLPCYGMAETTLAATGDNSGRGVRTVPAKAGQTAGLGLSELVCNGKPIIDTEVRISNPERPGEFLPEGQTGEVWVRGPGVFAGYFRDEAATREVLLDGGRGDTGTRR